jgi:hypothetical protein
MMFASLLNYFVLVNASDLRKSSGALHGRFKSLPCRQIEFNRDNQKPGQGNVHRNISRELVGYHFMREVKNLRAFMKTLKLVIVRPCVQIHLDVDGNKALFLGLGAFQAVIKDNGICNAGNPK